MKPTNSPASRQEQHRRTTTKRPGQPLTASYASITGQAGQLATGLSPCPQTSVTSGHVKDGHEGIDGQLSVGHAGQRPSQAPPRLPAASTAECQSSPHTIRGGAPARKRWLEPADYGLQDTSVAEKQKKRCPGEFPGFAGHPFGYSLVATAHGVRFKTEGSCASKLMFMIPASLFLCARCSIS